MILWIKLFSNFWTHRKTAKLRTKLGDDAYWVPIRIWSYAAEQQPDGDFSEYDAEQIAMLIGYSKDATSMLQALLEAGFFDSDMKIHDWQEHNAYHHAFAEKAKNAAIVRWGLKKVAKKETENEIEIEIDQASSKHTTSMLQASFEKFYEIYPKKIAKQDAIKAWKKINPDESLLQKILSSVSNDLKNPNWQTNNGQYIPNPATWLNGKRWEDQGLTSKPKEIGFFGLPSR